jgi:hypothetical protein
MLGLEPRAADLGVDDLDQAWVALQRDYLLNSSMPAMKTATPRRAS